VADSEYRIRHKNGEFRWVRDIGRCIPDPYHGEPLVQGVVYDITGQKESEEHNRLQQQRLIQADKMISLGFLLSGVAHEINNPNHIIMAHVSPLLKAWKQAEPILTRYYDQVGEFSLAGMPFPEARREIPAMFSAMLEGSNRIKLIVNELRDYARERPADMTEKVHINHVVKSAVTLCTNMLHKATARFTADFGDDLPPVKGNYQRLEQVVINLVQNACQALPGKEYGIRVSTCYDEAGRAVVLKVKDEGEGIPPESLVHITDPFFTTKRDTGGTGLGLSISYSIILEHRGTLSFDSRPRRGTTATVTLPVEEMETDEPKKEMERAE
jgi:polar amino acid transport system substrate-binding protein